jgi:AcrR family transcriptional regulator
VGAGSRLSERQHAWKENTCKRNGNFELLQSFLSFLRQINAMEPRERILHESMTQFMQYGARAVKLDDIATNLGMSKKTLYQYFPDKETLVFEVMQHVTQHKNCEIQGLLEEAADPIDALLRVNKYFNASLAEINPLLFMELRKYYPKAWNYFKEFQECHITQDVGNNLQKGIAMGLYRPDINVPLVSKMYHLIIEMVFDTDAFPIQTFTRLEVRKETFTIFLYGIATPAGRTLIDQYWEQIK